MKLAISDIKVGKRIRKDIGDLDSLCESMSELGLLCPIGVDADYKLIFGERRVKAAKKLKWEKIEVFVIKTLEDAISRLKAEGDENTCRKDFLPSEAVAMVETLLALEQKAAKERMALAGDIGRAKQQGKPGCGNLPQAISTGKSRDKVAPAAGMAPRTLQKALNVVKAAKEGWTAPAEIKRAKEEKRPPKVSIPAKKFEPVVDLMDNTSVDKADKEIKNIVRDYEAEQIRKQPPPKKKPGVKYDVIVVEPSLAV